MNDIECPYCEHTQEVCHDDGVGYEEDRMHEMQCEECEKYFTFTTYIHYSYTPYKADCLNGSPHRLKKMNIYPQYWPDAVRCEDCDYEKRGDYKPLESEKDTNAKT